MTQYDILIFNIIYFVLVALDMVKCIVIRFQNTTLTLLYHLQKNGTEMHVLSLSLYHKAHCKFEHICQPFIHIWTLV